MKQRMEYTPDNLQIFEGFYESRLYNSDMEYNYNYCLDEGEPECEIDDFKAFMEEVGNAAVECLTDVIGQDDDFVSNLKLSRISSPRYYNFTTDKLVIEADIDIDALKEWVLADDDRRNEFDSYLHKKYSSRDGFISFVENNVDGFFNESIEEYYDVLVDYYVLTKIYGETSLSRMASREWDTDYHCSLYEIADEIFYMHMVPIKEPE